MPEVRAGRREPAVLDTWLNRKPLGQVKRRMWCFHCERTVEVEPTGGGNLVCARCGGMVNRESANPADPIPSAAFVEIPRDEQPTVWNDWSADLELARVEAALDATRFDRLAQPNRAAPLDTVGRPFLTAATPPAHNDPPARQPPARQPRPGVWAWSVLLLGVMGLSFGAVLVGCSFMPGRANLWNAGLPVLLAGQIVLLFGLLLQIERVWHNSRWAGRRLEDVDRRIEELDRSATLWTTTASPSATAFYHHLAHGASPHILLADLKGQMDLLAQRTAQHR